MFRGRIHTILLFLMIKREGIGVGIYTTLLLLMIKTQGIGSDLHNLPVVNDKMATHRSLVYTTLLLLMIKRQGIWVGFTQPYICYRSIKRHRSRIYTTLLLLTIKSKAFLIYPCSKHRPHLHVYKECTWLIGKTKIYKK